LPLAPCPQEGCGGSLVAKKGKGRRLFYGCSAYKEDGSGCGFVTWDKPVDRPCPQCNSLLIERNTREAGFQIACAKCDYRERGEG
jgi:DNA topoisomerase-1